MSYRPSERSVDVYVSRLRRKLAVALPGQRLIHTHVRYGYRLTPAAGAGQQVVPRTPPLHCEPDDA